MVRLQEVSGVIQGLFVLELGSARLVEDLFGFVGEPFLNWLVGKLRNFIPFQIGCTLIAPLFEKAPQEEIVLQRFHVFLKCGGAGVDVLIDLLVVDQCSDRSLPLIDLGGDGPEIVRSFVDILHRALSGIEHLVRLVEQVRDLEWRLALNGVTLLYFGRLL